jgi:hypothetical protein
MLIVTTLVSIVLAVTTNGVVTIYFNAERHLRAIKSFDERSFMCNGDFGHKKAVIGPSNSAWISFARDRIHPWAYAEMKSLYVHANWSTVRPTFKQLRDVNGLQELSGQIDSLTMEDAKNIYAIPQLRTCIFATQGPVEPGAMPLIASKPGLKDFRLHPVDLETMAAIARNPSLTDLFVGERGVTLESMQTLCKSRSITKLGLMEMTVEAELLKPLAQMPQLKEFELYVCKFDHEVLAELVRLKMESIVIKSFHDALKMEITPLSNNLELRKLVIQSVFPRTDDDIATFANCPKLEELDFSEVQIAAESLSALQNMPSLKTVTFTGDLSNEIAQAFVDAVPGRELTLYESGMFKSGKRTFTSTKKTATTTKKT